MSDDDSAFKAGLCVGAALTLLFSLISTFLVQVGTRRQEQNKAIEVGVGEWVITDKMTGNTEFVYGAKK